MPHRPNKRWRGGDRALMDTHEPNIFSPHIIGARLTCQQHPVNTAHVRNVTVDINAPPNSRILSSRACRGSGVVADMVCVWDLIHHIFVVSVPLARLMRSSHSFSQQLLQHNMKTMNVLHMHHPACRGHNQPCRSSQRCTGGGLPPDGPH